MPTLEQFLKALQAGWIPTLAALLGCGFLVAGHWYGVPYFASLPDWVISIATAGGTLAFASMVSKIANLAVLAWKAVVRHIGRKQVKHWFKEQVDSAPDAEQALLAYLLSSNRKAFAAHFNDRRLTPLVAKGLLIRQGGAHNISVWPYIVQEDVWNYLQANRDQYFDEDLAEEPDLFD